MKTTPRFDNTYASLPERFFEPSPPEPVSSPSTLRVNRDLAQSLGFDPDWLATAEGAEVVAGNRIPEGAFPISTVYAGHQFGGWNPRMGDGRAVLLGEVLDTKGRRFDVQLKGSGRTPYSRGGDGRAPLGPVLREYIVSEAMAALGIPTSRSLAAATTGERVYRQGALPGGVLVRVAQSHIRVGTFEYFASVGDVEGVRHLLDHVIKRHYAELPALAQGSDPALSFLKAVMRRQADLVAGWMSVGFIHGVMNTDNTLVSGETIDYGPCAFMDSYDPATVFSSIDRFGRYAYANQPHIIQWNMARLAQALMPLMRGEEDEAVASAQGAIDAFPAVWKRAYRKAMAPKLGLSKMGAADQGMLEELLETMHSVGADFTLTFRRLSHALSPIDQEAAELGPLEDEFGPWIERWRASLAKEAIDDEARAAVMRSVNPVYIPRNHQVEAAIRDAVDGGDFGRFHRLVDILAHPYTFRAEDAGHVAAPRPDQCVLQTFCGT